MEETTNKETSLFRKVFDAVIPSSSNSKIFSAEKAWVETTYGRGTYHTIEERVKNKIKDIKARIESRCDSERPNASVFSSYYCVVDISDDLQYHIDEIFEPFISSGFQVINLSEQVDELKNERVYLVSWKNAFVKE